MISLNKSYLNNSYIVISRVKSNRVIEDKENLVGWWWRVVGLNNKNFSISVKVRREGESKMTESNRKQTAKW